MTPLALQDTFVRDLNRGDEDGVVALFDPQATLEADRYAAGLDEIRLWARMQISNSINIQVDPGEASKTGPYMTMWRASVRRQDWRAIGFESVVMTQVIWTVGPRIVHFGMFPNDGAVVPQLGDAWRPRSLPDARFLTQSGGEPGVNRSRQPSSAPLLAAAAGGHASRHPAAGCSGAWARQDNAAEGLQRAHRPTR